MRRWLVFLVLAGIGCATPQAQIPAPTELPSKPFFVKKTWRIGGEGNWDYLALDPIASQLYVAHGASVQVVDLSGGTLAGAIPGMRDAHGIALDDSGQYGYVSDGPANRVRIFDRRTLQIVASVPTGPSPRAVVFEPATKLVFAICTDPVATRPASPGAVRYKVEDLNLESAITVIDADKQTALGEIRISGKLGFALADGKGKIYVSLVARNQIFRFDAQTVLNLLRQQAAAAKVSSLPSLNWTYGSTTAPPPDGPGALRTFSLGAACNEPTGLAADGDHLRLFTACDNGRMQVLNTDTGEVVATLPIGPGTDAIGYDAGRGLIYTANGGGLGSVTIIRQTVTDSYAVIQELPTQQRARTLAVNTATGEVYLVTNLVGFDLTKKGLGGSTHTLPIVTATPVTGSFQVLVIGN